MTWFYGKILILCFHMYNMKIVRSVIQCGSFHIGKQQEVVNVVIEIDFNSDEAIYVQLMNQIILGIATSRLQEGDPLPSVRQLADTIGINMHTVNKAYSLLRQEGFVTIDRRRGAIIAVDENKIKAMEEMKENLIVALAKGCCRNVSREEVHRLIDEIYDEYGID